MTLATDAGKVRLITVVPSLDTPVCDTMTRRFNLDAANLPDSVVVYTISVDLPFAQKRWCGNAGIDKVQTLSDYQERSFGLNYGLLLKDLLLPDFRHYALDVPKPCQVAGEATPFGVRASSIDWKAVWVRKDSCAHGRWGLPGVQHTHATPARHHHGLLY